MPDDVGRNGLGGIADVGAEGVFRRAGPFKRRKLTVEKGRAHELVVTSLDTLADEFDLAVEEDRPNGEEGSFPSAHTAITFAGAEFIRKEYGWAWGAPAYAAASFVGWSRVETDDHWWHDVAAGAAIVRRELGR